MDYHCGLTDANCEGPLRTTPDGVLCGWHAATARPYQWQCHGCPASFGTRAELETHEARAERKLLEQQPRQP